MSMSDWLGVLGKIAPAAATLLGGPFAGIAVTAIGSALGLSQPTKDSIQKAIEQGQMTSDQIFALKKAELDVKAQLDANGIKLEDIAMEDRASARQMEISTHSMVPAILSTLITASILVLVGGFCFGIKVTDNPVAMELFGSLTSGWGVVMAYWFGTTRGSADKDRTLAQAVNKP